jgi:hypothetical protein
VNALPLLQSAWQRSRTAFALSDNPAVSDLCHEAMREIETAMLIIERSN